MTKKPIDSLLNRSRRIYPSLADNLANLQLETMVFNYATTRGIFNVRRRLWLNCTHSTKPPQLRR